jgi:tRNA A-37 threonylcarbamoyl transferase component Bud32
MYEKYYRLLKNGDDVEMTRLSVDYEKNLRPVLFNQVIQLLEPDIQAANSALGDIHRKGIAHGDSHSENLLRAQKDGRLYWIDFGLATELDGLSPDQTEQLVKYDFAFFKNSTDFELQTILKTLIPAKEYNEKVLPHLQKINKV